MRITDVTKQQHRELEELVRQVETAVDDDERLSLRAELGDLLAAHAQSKIVVLCPAALAQLGAGCRARESAEEVTVVCFALDRFLAANPSDPTFGARLSVLKDIMMNHIEEDECELLPQLESEVDRSELERLGTDATDALERSLRLGHRATLDAVLGPTKAPAKQKRARAKRVAGVRSHGDPADLRPKADPFDDELEDEHREIEQARKKPAKRGSGRATRATKKASSAQGGPKGTVKATKKATPKRVARAREPIATVTGKTREVVTKAQAATATKKHSAVKGGAKK